MDVLIILVYMASMLGIGVYALRRKKDVSDYYVGGRNLGSFSIGCLWMASWIGGATVVGSVDKAYSIGVAALWYCGSMSVGCVLFALTSTGLIQKIGAKFQALTYPELIEKRYGPASRLLAAVTTFLAYVAYTAGQFLAMASLLVGVTGWDLTACIWVSAASMVIYTAVGGFIAVAITGVAQAIIIVLALSLVMAPILLFQAGGFTAIGQALPPSYFAFDSWGWGRGLGLMLTIMLTFYTSMDSYTRCFASRNATTARRGTLFAAFLIGLVAAAAIVIGLSAKVLAPEAAGEISTMNAMMAFVPSGVKGLIIIGLLAAIMSTGSVCLLVASANVTQDVYKRFVNPRAASGALVALGGVSAVLVGLLAAYLAISRQDIIDVLYIAFTVNSAGLFIPTIVAFMSRKGGATAGTCSIGLSLLTVVFWYLGQGWFPDSALFAVDPVWPGLAVSGAVFFVGVKIFPLNMEDRSRIAQFWG
jgi:SSS family solute:Na+ symporter